MKQSNGKVLNEKTPAYLCHCGLGLCHTICERDFNDNGIVMHSQSFQVWASESAVVYAILSGVVKCHSSFVLTSSESNARNTNSEWAAFLWHSSDLLPLKALLQLLPHIHPFMHTQLVWGVLVRDSFRKRLKTNLFRVHLDSASHPSSPLTLLKSPLLCTYCMFVRPRT